MFRVCFFLLVILLLTISDSQANHVAGDYMGNSLHAKPTQTIHSSDCSSVFISVFDIPEDVIQQDVLKNSLVFENDLSYPRFNLIFFEKGRLSFYMFDQNIISVALFLLFEQIKIPF